MGGLVFTLARRRNPYHIGAIESSLGCGRLNGHDPRWWGRGCFHLAAFLLPRSRRFLVIRRIVAAARLLLSFLRLLFFAFVLLLLAFVLLLLSICTLSVLFALLGAAVFTVLLATTIVAAIIMVIIIIVIIVIIVLRTPQYIAIRRGTLDDM